MPSTLSPFDRFLLGLLGVVTGMLFWVLVLGARVQQHQPGLWTLRVQRIVDCGLDYNGPPYTKGDSVLWLTCGEDQGWKLWPPR
jgi:hypothetical protein